MLKVFWFRKDLRLEDNAALKAFIENIKDTDEILFLYIKNKNKFEYYGEKRINFLYQSLSELKQSLEEKGFHLLIAEGNSLDVFKKLKSEYKDIEVYANEQVEPYCKRRDKKIKEIISSFNLYKDNTIFPLGEIKNGEGNFYSVYTPFKNKFLTDLKNEYYSKQNYSFDKIKDAKEFKSKKLKEFELKFTDDGFIKGGRSEAVRLLKLFYDKKMTSYKEKRDLPDEYGTSFLSAHLHFGTIGIREVFRTAFNKADKTKSVSENESVNTWIKELIWREFYYNITFYNPRVIIESFRPEYDNLKWSYDEKLFKVWCDGKTGYPIVDAGMRQLNQTGWMHNRVRMITAMFLTKDLFMDWRLGEKYFAENLIDLDFSSNNGGWQWSSSTGCDSQPYFRIFNPVLQSEKFDAEGKYIKKYVPELKEVDAKYIHEPWEHEEALKEKYGIKLGKDYPLPVVNHSEIKERVISEFKRIQNLKSLSNRK